MDDMGTLGVARPGIRLQRMEVFNWGTFDSCRGKIHRIVPQGRSALLVGQNGSGKSTLVDALLTLLVQPGIRNYNVAAGAKKRERDERSYIRGACGRSSDDDKSSSITQFLRDGHSQYSALLAHFACEATQSQFTVAQLLYLQVDGSVEKFYLFADGERSIAEDLSGLDRVDRIKSVLIERGFRVTNKYNEYASWFSVATSIRSKAMDMFNQTVAVKDVQSLNTFVREHMLEARPWREKIDQLSSHYSQLSLAYQSLLRARRELEQLQPIESRVFRVRELEGSIAKYETLLEALEPFIQEQIIKILSPKITEWEKKISSSRRRKEQLTAELEKHDEQIRVYKNDLEHAGGERVDQISRDRIRLEVDRHNLANAQAKWKELLTGLGMEVSSISEDFFQQTRAKIETELSEWKQEWDDLDRQRQALQLEMARLRESIQQDRSEWTALKNHEGNLPAGLREVRSHMAAALNLDVKSLPFAAELLAVSPSESDWEASIEMVLHRFALSLIVPSSLIVRVQQYIERTKLIDAAGRGQRLVYWIAREKGVKPIRIEDLHRQSLLHKLEYRMGHPLIPWVQQELHQRFDYRCCDSLQEFQKADRMAMTKERHLRFGDHRAEKDDRPKAIDPRYFVLGWNNLEKREKLEAQCLNKELQLSTLQQRLQTLLMRQKDLQQRSQIAEELEQFSDFDKIDLSRCQQELSTLDQELRSLQESNDVAKVLAELLEQTKRQKKICSQQRDEAIAEESRAVSELKSHRNQIDRAQQMLNDLGKDVETLGSLRDLYPTFSALVHETDPTLESCYLLEKKLGKEWRTKIQELVAQVDPIRMQLVGDMQRFLNEFPEEGSDLKADLNYADGFLGLLEHLRKEDLPRHESRFRDRMNEKVVQEMGLFHAHLQSERLEILNKLDRLNRSLEELDYSPGTYLRLEPRPVSDPEIREFQGALRECLDQRLEGSLEGESVRFARIERLVHRLRTEERWRDKVTDVRRWFDFAARETDRETGFERAYYEDSSGQSGGEKAKLAFTILVAAIAYQYDLDASEERNDRFHFVVVDEMFSKVDDRYAEYALKLFEKFGLQLLIVAPLDAKARVTEPFVGCYLQTVKDESSKTSHVYTMTVEEYAVAIALAHPVDPKERIHIRHDAPHTPRGPRRPK